MLFYDDFQFFFKCKKQTKDNKTKKTAFFLKNVELFKKFPLTVWGCASPESIALACVFTAVLFSPLRTFSAARFATRVQAFHCALQMDISPRLVECGQKVQVLVFLKKKKKLFLLWLRDPCCLVLLKWNSFSFSSDANMPIIRTLSKVAQRALLGTPVCGCQPLAVAVRNISFSPRQVTSDASFHSASFSETDHPRVLITGMFIFCCCCFFALKQELILTLNHVGVTVCLQNKF